MNAKINHLSQICSAKFLKYTSGKQKDVNIILVNNGKLTFEVLVDKCMDIAQTYHKGTNISFISANGIDNFSNDFGTFYNGGLVYTCGLDNLGRRAEPIHGKIHSIPANLQSCIVDENGVEIKGFMEQTSLFGDKLRLTRTITTKVNSDVIEINDCLENFGHKDANYCLLYHVNMGYPMLDEGVKIVSPMKQLYSNTPCTDAHLLMDKPDDLIEEKTYYNSVDTGYVCVQNDKLKKQFILEYDKAVLPCIMEWKSMGSGDYALGLEPATTTLDKNFEHKIIKAQQKINFGVKITIKDF